ncbi:MAG: amidohydrolase family protein [Saprospiraceae bacterium]|nr:amidohydrolase family protein [Saprospiraceae bacterium]
MNRRSLFKTLTVGAISASTIKTAFTGAKESFSADPEKKGEIIEWNAHIFSPDTTRYPFHAKATYRPDVTQNAADPLKSYLERLNTEGIDRAVIVHPEPYGDDHRLILDCLRREPDRLRGTSLFYPRDSEAPRKLKQLVEAEPRIVATRFHALKGNEAYLTSFADPGVIKLWQQAYELDLVLELHIGPDYAYQAAKLMEEYPGSKVLIDHLAEPHLGNAAEFAEVLELARFPQCYMKLSGLNHFAKDEPLYKSALPFTRRVIREFGPNRVVWGSGTPDIIEAHCAGYTEDEMNLVRGGNIRRLINW